MAGNCRDRAVVGESRRHTAYGLVLEADAPVFGFGPAPDSRATDVRFWFDSQPDWAAGALRLPRQPLTRGWSTRWQGQVVREVHTLGAEEFFHIVYADQTEFVVSADGRRVYAGWVAPLTLADTLTYALGPITAICLRRLGRACLHGSAVAFGASAVLFVGGAGAGKSTTAAALVRRGAAALSDDVAALDWSGETPTVQPGHAWYRLWPESVRLICGSETALPLLTPNWEKRYFDATQHLAGVDAVPVRCVFFLERQSIAGQPLIEHVPPRESFLRLQAHTLGAPFVDATGRAREFRLLSNLACCVPCSVIHHPRSSLSLDELLDAIERTLTCHAVG